MRQHLAVLTTDQYRDCIDSNARQHDAMAAKWPDIGLSFHYREARRSIPWEPALVVCTHCMDGDELEAWCESTGLTFFHNHYFYKGTSFFEFETEEDAAIFLLMWRVEG